LPCIINVDIPALKRTGQDAVTHYTSTISICVAVLLMPKD